MHMPEMNTCILYGGVAQEPLNGIAQLAVYGNTDCKWDIIFPQYKCDSSKLVGRYGFQGLYYDKKLFFIFGCVIYNKQRKERTCLNEIVIYDPYTNELNVRYPFHKPDKLLNPRKYFAGFFLHDTFYCHGGIDTRGKVMRSFI